MNFEYAQDQKFSVMTEIISNGNLEFSKWNLDCLVDRNHWSAFIDKLEYKYYSLFQGYKIDGVDCSEIYIGTAGTKSSFHIEDVSLAAVSYLFPNSAPKLWLCVHPKYHPQLVKMGKNFYPKCSHPFSHKDLLLTVELLEAANIEYWLINQEPNTFVIVMPAVYHQIHNVERNLAEAVNFIPIGWQPIGK